MKKRLNKKGFTLIELIVVIAILGILAAIAIPRLSGFTNKAKASACEAEARTVLTALSAMYAESSTSISTTTDEEDTALLDMTGTLNGALDITDVTNGDLDFTYTQDGFVTTVTDSSIASTAVVTP